MLKKMLNQIYYYRCTAETDVYSLLYDDKLQKFNFYLTSAKYGLYVCLWSWVTQLVLLFVRFFTGYDFKILVVAVYSEDHVSFLACFIIVFLYSFEESPQI